MRVVRPLHASTSEAIMRSLTELASKAMGAAKAASATLAGYRGIFRTLKREHGEVSVLMMRIATDRDRATRAQLFPVIVRELLAHARAEDAAFYAVLADHESTRPLVLQLEADHEHARLADQVPRAPARRARARRPGREPGLPTGAARPQPGDGRGDRPPLPDGEGTRRR
jgi:hypothetical protein